MSKTNPNIATKKRVLPWAALIICVLGISVIAALYWQQNLRVKSVTVVGNYYTEKAEIIETADVEIGIHPDSLNFEQIKSEIGQLPYVHSVIPYVDALGTLKLTVRERFPLALLMSGSDEIYVDAYGVKLPILEGKTRNLPIVYGFNARMNSDTLSSEAFVQIRDFLVSALNNPLGWTTISEIAFDPYDGVVALSHENGVKLLFGRNEFDIKLRNWEAFYADIISVKGINSMQQVDLRFTNQVVTREDS